MNPDSILFAMANPIPEILPDALNVELANVVAQAVKRYI